MALKFGFELEGFYKEDNSISLPPKNYPTDGFPGLCEVRTIGGNSLDKAYFELLNEFRKYPFDKDTFEHTFSAKEKAIVRSRWAEKSSVSIQNIYNKSPRLIGNKTIASFQISFSNQTGVKYTDKNGSIFPETFGLLDFVPVIRNLDEEFSNEIKSSNRQKGFYAIKENRVEYRSLPNSVFTTDIGEVSKLLGRIQNCFGDM